MSGGDVGAHVRSQPTILPELRSYPFMVAASERQTERRSATMHVPGQVDGAPRMHPVECRSHQSPLMATEQLPPPPQTLVDHAPRVDHPTFPSTSAGRRHHPMSLQPVPLASTHVGQCGPSSRHAPRVPTNRRAFASPSGATRNPRPLLGPTTTSPSGDHTGTAPEASTGGATELRTDDVTEHCSDIPPSTHDEQRHQPYPSSDLPQSSPQHPNPVIDETFTPDPRRLPSFIRRRSILVAPLMPRASPTHTSPSHITSHCCGRTEYYPRHFIFTARSDYRHIHHHSARQPPTKHHLPSTLPSKTP